MRFFGKWGRRAGNRRMTPAVGRPTLRERLAGALAATGRALRRSFPAFLALALAAGLVVGAVRVYRFATTSPRFAIKVITLPPLKHARVQTLLARLAIAPGTNIFRADLDELAARLEEDPWIARARVRRELPGEIIVSVTEREPAALVVMGGLYLADAQGRIFKRAQPGDGEGLPLITGLARDSYGEDPEAAAARVRGALEADREIRRSTIGQHVAFSELHLEEDGGLTLFTLRGGTEIRLGRGALADKLARFGVVWRALGADQGRARAIYLGDQSPDRVIVRLEPLATVPAAGASASGAVLQ